MTEPRTSREALEQKLARSLPWDDEQKIRHERRQFNLCEWCGYERHHSTNGVCDFTFQIRVPLELLRECLAALRVTPPASHNPACSRELAQTLSDDTVALLTQRMQWYRDGCPHLEDVAGYYASGDCARDAAGDLETALSEIRVLNMVIAKLREPRPCQS